MKRKLSIATGLAVSAAFLWLACRHVDFHALAAILAGIEPAPLLLVVVGVCAELLIRGIKWRLLLAPSGPVRAWDTTRIEAAGLALNNVLPLRLGEVARAAFAANYFKLPIATILSTILAEKALDFAALLLLAAVAAAASGIALPIAGRGPVILAVAIALCALALLVDGAAASGRLTRHPGVQRTLNSLKLGLTAFTSPVTAVCVCSLALLQWFINSLNYYWIALAFGLNSITVTKSVLLSFTGAAASSAPGMPGYFGSFELGISAVLTAWGINREAALAYAATAHILSYLIITAAGLFFIYQMGQSLGKIWDEFSAKKPEGGRTMESSSHIHRENTDSVGDQHTLPEGYGTTEAVLLPRDPNWMFIYWEISDQTKAEVRAKQGTDIFENARQVIRVYDTTSDSDARKYFDNPVLMEAKSWYINVPESGRTYCCEVGLATPEGGFISLVRTNNIQLPAGRLSDTADGQWLSVTPDFDKLLQLSGVEYIGKGSGEVARSLAQRWEALRGIFSKAEAWGVNSITPPAQQGTAQKKFWLAADCEVILYGATEPDALVSVCGRKVPLNSDGTFSMRFALPDGGMNLPVKAVSRSGADTREIEIKVTRTTKSYDK